MTRWWRNRIVKVRRSDSYSHVLGLPKAHERAVVVLLLEIVLQRCQCLEE